VLSLPYLNIVFSLRGTKHSSKPLFKSMIKEQGVYVASSYILKQLLSNIPNWVIKAFWNLDVVALYGFARNVYEAAIGLFSSIETVLLPTLSEEITRNRERFAGVFRRATKYSFWISCILVVPAVAVSPFLISFIGHDKYSASSPILQILLLSFIPLGLGNAQRSAFFAFNSQKYILYYTSFMMLVLIILSFPMAFYLGTLGMAFAEMLTLLLATFFKFYLLKRLDKSMSIRFRDLSTITTYDKKIAAKALRKILSIAKMKARP
jgi:O-antigen/teichoic acid export membrane protein